MKFAIAAAFLVSSCAAFQQPNPATSFRDVGLRAIDFDPTTASIPSQGQEAEETKGQEIDMTGIALSVSYQRYYTRIWPMHETKLRCRSEGAQPTTMLVSMLGELFPNI